LIVKRDDLRWLLSQLPHLETFIWEDYTSHHVYSDEDNSDEEGDEAISAFGVEVGDQEDPHFSSPIAQLTNEAVKETNTIPSQHDEEKKKSLTFTALLESQIGHGGVPTQSQPACSSQAFCWRYSPRPMELLSNSSV
jgi:hypothetical protein